MADHLLRRYFWLVDTIRTFGPMTYQDINDRWRRSILNEYGQDLPKKTFRNHIEAIWQSLGIEIACDRKDGYRYYIQDEETKDKWMTNLLDTLSIQAAIGDGTGMKERIVDYDVCYDPKIPLLAHLIEKRCVIRFRVFISFEEARQNPETAHYEDIDFKYFNFCPLGLVKVMRKWYVIMMFCKEGRFYRNIFAFLIDYLTEISVMEGKEVPDYPEDFSVKEYIANMKEDWTHLIFNQTDSLYDELHWNGIVD